MSGGVGIIIGVLATLAVEFIAVIVYCVKRNNKTDAIAQTIDGISNGIYGKNARDEMIDEISKTSFGNKAGK